MQTVPYKTDVLLKQTHCQQTEANEQENKFIDFFFASFSIDISMP